MEDKKTLITIIILLAIFLPASIVGTSRHLNATAEEGLIDDNPNQDLIYNNKVYFYLDGELLSIYECSTCSKTVTTIDDDAYHTNYYADGDYEIPTVLNSSVALITEDGVDYIYSIASSITLNGYDALKDYRIEHTEQILIASDEGYWGVLTLTDSSIQVAINYMYEYISVPAHLVNGKLDTEKIIVKLGETWRVINYTGSGSYVETTMEIVDFNDNYYVTYDGSYHIINSNHIEYLTDIEIDNAYGVGSYMFVITNGDTLLIYGSLNSSAIETVTLPSYTSIYFNQVDGGVEIIIDGNLYQTIELS